MVDHTLRDSDAQADVVSLAQAKLSYLDSPVAKLAVLDVTLSLDYNYRHPDIYNNFSDMVARHMRTAYSIPGHRNSLSSGYPSEPVLAEATLEDARG